MPHANLLNINSSGSSRVRAILYLKKLEAIARERGDWVAPNDELDEAYEAEFGKVEVGYAAQHPHARARARAPAVYSVLTMTDVRSFEENVDKDLKYEELSRSFPPQMFVDAEADPAEIRAYVTLQKLSLKAR